MVPKRADFSVQGVPVSIAGISSLFYDPWAKTTLTSLFVWGGQL
jgi:hypothetical protein